MAFGLKIEGVESSLMARSLEELTETFAAAIVMELKHISFIVLSLAVPFSSLYGREVLEFNRDIRPILSDKCFFATGRIPASERQI